MLNWRLDKYKRKLMEDQPKFLRDKADKLKHIMAEEKDLGLEPTVFQVRWLVSWLVGWLVGWLVIWVVGWMVGWIVG